jgi:hypothetical protein
MYDCGSRRAYHQSLSTFFSSLVNIRQLKLSGSQTVISMSYLTQIYDGVTSFISGKSSSQCASEWKDPEFRFYVNDDGTSVALSLHHGKNSDIETEFGEFQPVEKKDVEKGCREHIGKARKFIADEYPTYKMPVLTDKDVLTTANQLWEVIQEHKAEAKSAKQQEEQ